MNKNQHISVLLMGGLGNQVFQFSFCKWLESIGYKVTVDTSNFTKFEDNESLPFIHRKQIFPIEYFGFEETSTLLKFGYTVSENLKKTKVIPNFLNFTSEINDYNYKNINFKRINKAIGYWQDISLLESNKEFIKQSLSKNKKISESFKKNITGGSTALHVRRGDYVNIDENLKNKFYEDSLNYCKKNIIDFKFNVFTDDFNWVDRNPIFKDAECIHSDDIGIENTIDSFSKILLHENFIVGNSTFSLIAAILNLSKGSHILVAEPWFRNKNRDLNIPDNWIKINNS